MVREIAKGLARWLRFRLCNQQLITAVATHAGVGLAPDLPFATGAYEFGLAVALFLAECPSRRVNAFDVSDDGAVGEQLTAGHIE